VRPATRHVSARRGTAWVRACSLPSSCVCRLPHAAASMHLQFRPLGLPGLHVHDLSARPYMSNPGSHKGLEVHTCACGLAAFMQCMGPNDKTHTPPGLGVRPNPSFSTLTWQVSPQH
jgi:hypothetical protein